MRPPKKRREKIHLVIILRSRHRYIYYYCVFDSRTEKSIQMAYRHCLYLRCDVGYIENRARSHALGL